MHQFGKTMKITNFSKFLKETALKQLLANYSGMPLPATGISLASMMFSDGQEETFRRITASDNIIKYARERDCYQKERKKVEVNKSKFRKDQQIK